MMHISYLIQFHVMSLLLSHQANCTIVNVVFHDSLHFTKKKKEGEKKNLRLVFCVIVKETRSG